MLISKMNSVFASVEQASTFDDNTDSHTLMQVTLTQGGKIAAAVAAAAAVTANAEKIQRSSAGEHYLHRRKGEKERKISE